jgi:hypothetical protein
MSPLQNDVDHVRDLLTHLNRSRHELDQTRAHHESIRQPPRAGLRHVELGLLLDTESPRGSLAPIGSQASGTSREFDEADIGIV